MNMFWNEFRSMLREYASYLSILIEPWVMFFASFELDRSPRHKRQKMVIFVRHPHTNEEVDQIYRGPYARITRKGREQGQMVARRLSEVGGVTHVVTSTLPRSRRLARGIALQMASIGPLPVILASDLFVEIKKPTEFIGVRRDDPHVVRVSKRIRRLFDYQYRYSDEENRWRVEFRIQKALRFLAELDADNVVVVTHGKFLRAVWHYLYECGTLRGYYPKADRILKHDNTGITIIKLEPGFRTGPQWNFETWNDTSHTQKALPEDVLRALAARP